VTSRGQRIIVVDPAVQPSEPAAPNRNLIVAAGFGAGGVLTLVMLFLMDLLNRTVRRPAELVGALGITPFGTIPYIETEDEHRSQRMRLIAGTVVAVICLPVMLYLFSLFLTSGADPVASAVATPGLTQAGQPEN
jgi:hypothetical protein